LIASTVGLFASAPVGKAAASARAPAAKIALSLDLAMFISLHYVPNIETHVP
jgi:hypothetical protein